MLQVRKLVLAIAAATTFTSGVAQALGLGELSVKSSLNQPLNAEIELLEVRDLTDAELRVGLASPEDFSRAGIDRQFFLTGLKFTPVVKPNGRSVIRVTSNKPVNEPFLNFMMEVMWPEGRVLREYTMLLDPPSYTPQAVIPTTPPVTAPHSVTPSKARQPQPVQAARQPQSVSAPSAAGRAAPSQSLGDSYRVKRNDRLWDIAQKASGGASVQQTMLAIQDLNPNAFVNGNINQLKAGQVLRLPTAEQIRQRSLAQANAEVQSQAQAWRQGRNSARQVDATKREQAGARPAELKKDDNLRLVADAGKASSAGDKGNAASSAALNDQLAVTKESLDSTRLQNEELQTRVVDLESQLDKLQKLIELKDTQLANLQGGPELAVTSPVETPVVEEQESEPVVTEPKDEEPVPVIDEPVTPAVEDVTEPETVETEDNGQIIESVEPVNEEPTEVVEPAPIAEIAKPAAPAPAPVVTPAPIEEQSFIDSILANPMLLAALGGGALALLLLLMLRKRAAARDEEEYELLEDPSVAVPPVVTAPVVNNVAEKPEEVPLGAGQGTAISIGEEPVPGLDVVSQADLYLSAGSYLQAVELLKQAVAVEPENISLRTKLAEAYGELDNGQEFAQQINEMQEIGASAEHIDKLKSRFAHLLGVGSALGIAEVSENSLIDADIFDQGTTSLDEFSAELDDFSTDLTSNQEDSSLDAGFEFELDKSNDLNDSDDKELVFEPPLVDSLVDIELDTEDQFSLPAESHESASSLEVGDEFGEMLDAIKTDEANDLGFDTKDLDFDLSKMEAELNEFDTVGSGLEGFETLGNSEDLSDFDALLDSPQEMNTDISLGDEPVASVVNENAPVINSPELEELGFLPETNEVDTKLDLASAYIEMDDQEGAKEMLNEVLLEGNEQQKSKAEALLNKLS